MSYNCAMSKILVYDADPAFRDGLKAAVAALGYEVVLCTNGYDVLPLATQHKPALIILDYKLPEAAGFEILQRLRAQPGFATPVIFISATPKFEIEMTVLDTTGVGFVDKPLDPAQLKETIEAMLGPRVEVEAAPAAAPAPAPAPSMYIPPPGAPLDEPAAPAFNGEPDLDGRREDVIDLD